MTVEEFIAEYNSAENKEKCIKKHIIKDKYVPYVEKITRCENIVDHTMYEQVDGVKTFKQNSPIQHILFVLTLVELYTNIDIKFDGINFIECFDLLERYDLIDDILMLIPEHEIEMWNTFFNMCIDDVVENTRSIGGIIDTKLAASKSTLDMIQDALLSIASIDS